MSGDREAIVCDIPRRNLPLRFTAVAAGLALLGLAALPLDLPIARWFHDGRCPAEILRCLSFAETYAHGFGVTCILLTVLVLDTTRWRLMPRTITLSLGAGLLANVVKLLVTRTRPHEFDLSQNGSVWQTFGHWIAVGHVASGQQSFPSAHMATAVGLTAALAWRYPRGRYLFLVFALLAGCQRMSSASHYLSDVIWGAAVGATATALFMPGGLISKPFDRIESPGNKTTGEMDSDGANVQRRQQAA